MKKANKPQVYFTNYWVKNTQLTLSPSIEVWKFNLNMRKVNIELGTSHATRNLILQINKKILAPNEEKWRHAIQSKFHARKSRKADSTWLLIHMVVMKILTRKKTARQILKYNDIGSQIVVVSKGGIIVSKRVLRNLLIFGLEPESQNAIKLRLRKSCLINGQHK